MSKLTASPKHYLDSKKKKALIVELTTNHAFGFTTISAVHKLVRHVNYLEQALLSNDFKADLKCMDILDAKAAIHKLEIRLMTARMWSQLAETDLMTAKNHPFENLWNWIKVRYDDILQKIYRKFTSSY